MGKRRFNRSRFCVFFLLFLGGLLLSDMEKTKAAASSYEDAQVFYDTCDSRGGCHAEFRAGDLFYATKAKQATNSTTYGTIGFDITLTGDGASVSFSVKRNGDGTMQELVSARRSIGGYEYILYSISAEKLYELAHIVDSASAAVVQNGAEPTVHIDSIMVVKKEGVEQGGVSENGSGGLNTWGTVYHLKNDSEWLALRNIFYNHDFASYRNINRYIPNYILSIRYDTNGGTLGNGDYTAKKDTIYKDGKVYYTKKRVLQKVNLTDRGTFKLTKTGYHLEAGQEWKSKYDGNVYSQSKDYMPKEIYSAIGEHDKGITMQANWKANTYTIKYRGNYPDSGSLDNQNAAYNQSISLRTNAGSTRFVKAGYTFAGWNTEIDGGGEHYEPGESVKNLTTKNHGTVILYAEWEPIVAMIYFHPGVSSAVAASDEFYIASDNGKRYAYRTSTRKKVTATITCEVTKMEFYNVKTLFKRNGYTVATGREWRIGSNTAKKYLSQEKATSASGVKIMQDMIKAGATEIHLYANWKEEDDKSAAYYVYHYQQNLVNDEYTLTESEQGEADAGTKVTPAVKSYIGFTSPSAVTVTVKEDSSTVVEYRYTRNKSSLKIEPNGGIWNGSTETQLFENRKYGSTEEILLPTRRGHTFTTWQKSSPFYGSIGTLTAPADYTFGSVAGVTDTLTAQWSANIYSLTVKPNGGIWNSSRENSILSVACEETRIIEDPVREGYTFEGWTLTGAGSSIKKETKTFTMGYEDAVLEANWIAHNYRVEFDGNGATGGSMEGISATVGENFKLPKNQFKRILDKGESKFLGWALKPDSSAAEYEDEAEIFTALAWNEGETVVLYAIWDDCPEIEAIDRYFTLEQAQSGYIDETVLLEKVKATDREDGDLVNGTDVIVLYYQEEDFTGFTADGAVSVTYQATDSQENAVIKMVMVYIVDMAVKDVAEQSYVRFISDEFYREEDDYVKKEQGGLEKNSVWKEDEMYRRTLTYALSNKKNREIMVNAEFMGMDYEIIKPGSGFWEHKVETWTFTTEQIQAVKDFILCSGYGKNRKMDGIREFCQLFSGCRE